MGNYKTMFTLSLLLVSLPIFTHKHGLSPGEVVWDGDECPFSVCEQLEWICMDFLNDLNALEAAHSCCTPKTIVTH